MLGHLNIWSMMADLMGQGTPILVNNGAPTNGITGKNLAGKGALLTDKANGKLYINTGTTASPTWTVVGTQT